MCFMWLRRSGSGDMFTRLTQPSDVTWGLGRAPRKLLGFRVSGLGFRFHPKTFKVSNCLAERARAPPEPAHFRVLAVFVLRWKQTSVLRTALRNIAAQGLQTRAHSLEGSLRSSGFWASLSDDLTTQPV